MTENVYEKLRELIDTHPIGCPSSPEIIQILKILFSEEEATVALGPGFSLFTVEQISQRAGMNPQEAWQHLESLADKGVVFAREKNGVWGYALLNSIQLFENPYRKGVHNETIKNLTVLWEKYRPTLLPKLGGETTSFLRVIPIEKKIESNAKILPYEKVYEMIDEAKVLGISRCACREFSQNCDSPREGPCSLVQHVRI